MEPYSIFIPIAPKDNNKIKFLIRSVEQFLTGFTDIHLCVPNLNNFDPRTTLFPETRTPVHVHEDRKILDIDPRIFKYRPGWIYQQMVKMFQRVTDNDLFLTIDSDVIINRSMPMFHENQRLWWMGWEQMHTPYFLFNQKMFGLERVYPHTFINDMNFMDRKIIIEMITSRYTSIMDFISKSAEIISDNIFIAEPELYGNYVMKYHPNLYLPRQANSTFEGRSSDDPNSLLWPDQDIEDKITIMRSQNYDLFMLHSWCGNNIYDWRNQ